MEVPEDSPMTSPGALKQFQPFTALSPTVEPPSRKQAKARLAEDFRASGHMKLAQGDAESHRGVVPRSPPNALKIAVELQSEPGLQGWWNGVSKVARECFGAERATLAVPSDITDIENVPWAQLATYRADDEDVQSKVTNDRTSDRSNLTEVSIKSRPQEVNQQQTQRKPRTPLGLSEQNVPFARNAAQSLLANRPRLEARHSYAGYPLKEKTPPSEIRMSLQRPKYNRASSSAAAADQAFRPLELNEEALEQHDQAYMGRLSEESTQGQTPGRILDVVQPLENEADALIDGAGVFKVVHRGAPILLTRQYRELLDDRKRERAAAKESLAKRGPAKSHPKARPALQRGKSTLAKTNLRTLEESPDKLSDIPYEDYEQLPASPWSQSPAPSPAGRNETDENPFFVSGVDQSAFEPDFVPELDREQTGSDNIPAIGIDQAATIIQIPLIHPNSRVSQRTRKGNERRRDTLGSNTDGTRSMSTSTLSRMPEESISSDERFKRTPVAILSLLVPLVPYPMYLTNALLELSPMMAASFVTARQHTSMAKDLEMLRRKERIGAGMASEISLQTEQSDASQILADRDHDDPSSLQRALSPASTASIGSRQPSSPSDFAGDHHQLPLTPGFVAADSKKAGTRGPKTPAATLEIGESYFVANPGNERPRPESAKTVDSTAASAAKLATAKSELNKKIGDNQRMRLRSQGASFAATHPALPTAIAAVQPAEAGPAELSKPGTPYASYHNHTALKPGNDMLRTMIDNGATQQWIAAGHDGTIIWANAKFLVYRQSEGEELDNDFWDSILAKERQSFRTEWSKALQTGEQFAKSCRLRRFNGQYRMFHVRIIPIKDRHGATKFFHGQAMDIHEQHEAEQSALKAKMYRNSEAKYRALANSLPVIVFAAHLSAGVTFANTQWLSYSGQDVEEAAGFGFLDHVHPDDLAKCRFPGFEKTQMAATFGVSPSSATRNPLYRQDSGTSTTSSHDSDATSATEATARPKDSPGADSRKQPGQDSELLRRLAEDGIVMYDVDSQGNFSVSTELRLKSKTGEYRWHVVSGSFLDSVNFGAGESQWFIACTDITTQKLTEARMQDAKVALEDANSKLAQEVKSKMSYLSSMSHEIRTPLNGIIGNLQFLINTGLAEEAYEWAHGAKDAATNMSELINDILDLSKAEANMLTLSTHTFSPRELTENVLDQLNSRTTEKRLELSAEFDERVPLFVRGDSGRMRQVLLNLVTNAVKFTSQGEIWITCDVLNFPPYGIPRAGEHERLIQWTVNDTGKGFSEKDKDLLFKEYSQIKRRSDKDIGGTGLGLILCKTMVELHGGKIEANGEPGKGACFNFFARFKLRKGKSKLKGPTTRLLDSLQQKSASTVSAPNTAPPSPSLASTESQSPIRTAGMSYVRTTPQAAAGGSVSSVPPESPGYHKRQMSAVRLPSNSSLTSPTVSSAGSSILSGVSGAFSRSIRSASSVSTTDTKVASMKLTLPDISDKSPTASMSGPMSSDTLRAGMEGTTPNLDTFSFRPPMYSVLLYCPVENARRSTAEQIQYVVPKGVPCQITAEADLEKALDLISGEDPVTFTHVVVRTSRDQEALEFVDQVVASLQHIHTALVLITDQTQIRAFKDLRPELDIKSMQKQEKLIVVQRPCHTYKLCKVFDPLKENEASADDPLTAKRKEEKRLQKESYMLFKNVLSSRNLRILAVEDNRVQMNVLTNFLSKICGLEVICAWNGQECLDLLYSHPPLYYSAIVSDIEMPLVGGYEMVRRIRAWELEKGYPPVPTVSLSANTVKEGWHASAEAGFTHYSPKPVNFRDLGHVLLEITAPERPHVYLKDRPLPRELSGEKDDSSDESGEE